jgi:hypothetical protein
VILKKVNLRIDQMQHEFKIGRVLYNDLFEMLA